MEFRNILRKGRSGSVSSDSGNEGESSLKNSSEFPMRHQSFSGSSETYVDQGSNMQKVRDAAKIWGKSVEQGRQEDENTKGGRGQKETWSNTNLPSKSMSGFEEIEAQSNQLTNRHPTDRRFVINDNEVKFKPSQVEHDTLGLITQKYDLEAWKELIQENRDNSYRALDQTDSQKQVLEDSSFTEGRLSIADQQSLADSEYPNTMGLTSYTGFSLVDTANPNLHSGDLRIQPDTEETTDNKLKNLSKSTIDLLKQLRSQAINIMTLGPSAKNIDKQKEIKVNVEELLLNCESASKTLKDNIQKGRKDEANLAKNDRKTKDGKLISYPSSPSEALANLYRCTSSPLITRNAELLPETLKSIANDIGKQSSLGTTGVDSDTKHNPDNPKKRSRAASITSKISKDSERTYETETGTTISTHEIPENPDRVEIMGGIFGISVPKPEVREKVHKRRIIQVNKEREIRNAFEALNSIESYMESDEYKLYKVEKEDQEAALEKAAEETRGKGAKLHLSEAAQSSLRGKPSIETRSDAKQRKGMDDKSVETMQVTDSSSEEENEDNS